MRIYTTTGEDINVDAKGKGENKQQEVKAEQAQTGSMKAVGDIIINVQETPVIKGLILILVMEKSLSQQAKRLNLNKQPATSVKTTIRLMQTPKQTSVLSRTVKTWRRLGRRP